MSDMREMIDLVKLFESDLSDDDIDYLKLKSRIGLSNQEIGNIERQEEALKEELEIDFPELSGVILDKIINWILRNTDLHAMFDSIPVIQGGHTIMLYHTNREYARLATREALAFYKLSETGQPIM